MEPSPSAKTSQTKEDDQITLKEVFLFVRNWGKYILSQWKLIIFACTIGGSLGLAYSLWSKNRYKAKLTFVLEDTKSSPLASYAGIASQFGVDLGGPVNSGVFSGDNILEFMKSRLMVEKTLLSAVNYKNKKVSLADLYISINGLREKWKIKPELKSISLPFNAERSSFSRVQDSVLKIVYNSIIEENLNVTKPDKKLSFIVVEVSSLNEVFSKLFAERLVSEATGFYIQTKTQRSKASIDKLQAKADSLEKLLNNKTYSVAATQDINQNPIRRIATVGTQLAMRDQVVLQTMYGEVIKNLELSRMAMSQETPIIQIVDTPILPLDKSEFGWLKGTVLGGVLGGILIIIFIILRRLLKEIMT